MLLQAAELTVVYICWSAHRGPN